MSELKNMTDEEFDQRLKADFLLEATDIVQDLEKKILVISEGKSSSGGSEEIKLIFRFVHTLKGSAGMAGFQALANYIHTFETLLSDLRDQKYQATDDIITAMLHGVDALNDAVRILTGNHKADIDPSASLAELKAILAARGRTEYANASGEGHLSTESSAATPPPESEEKPRKLTVLVVDDSEDIRDIICDFIAPLDVNIITGKDGEEGVKLWDKHHHEIDLVITDQVMPKLNGHEFVEHIRKNYRTETPIMVISGMIDRNAALSYMNLGVFGFIPKPIDDLLLVEAVKKALRFSQYHKALEELSNETIRSYTSFRKVMSLLDIPSARDDLYKHADKFSARLKKMGLLVKQVLENKKAS